MSLEWVANVFVTPMFVYTQRNIVGYYKNDFQTSSHRVVAFVYFFFFFALLYSYLGLAIDYMCIIYITSNILTQMNGKKPIHKRMEANKISENKRRKTIEFPFIFFYCVSLVLFPFYIYRDFFFRIFIASNGKCLGSVYALCTECM